MNINKFLNQEIETDKSTEVEHYHGVEGIKKIYEKTLETNGTILALTAVTKDIHPDLYKWLVKEYAKKRKERKIFAKVIAPKTERSEDYLAHDQENYRKTLLIPADKFPISIEMNIFDDKVALFSYSSEELLGVLIRSKRIAQTMKLFFELSWEKALDYQRDWDERF